MGATMTSEIKVWLQMFFEDGSVSEGKRFPATILDEPESMREIARGLLRELNRTEGYMLSWGAGNVLFEYYNFSSYPSEVSEISASEPLKA